MASRHSAAVSGQHQLPATIQPLQTLTQSFVAKQQQQNRHGAGAYSSAFSNGPSPLQHLSSSSGLSQQQLNTQQQQQSSHRSSETSGVVLTTHPQQSPVEAASTDKDVQMHTEDVPSTSMAEASEITDIGGASTSTVNATPSSSEKRKRGRPKGSKTKRVGAKGETNEQLHQQEVVMMTEPSTTTTSSPSISHSQPPQAKPPQAKDEAVGGPDATQADSFDSSLFLSLAPPPEAASRQLNRTNSGAFGQARTRSPSRDDKSTLLPTEETTKKLAKSPGAQHLSPNTGGSGGHEDMLPVYEFYWNMMTLCADFFQAATELLSATPSPVLARAFGSLNQPPPVQLLEQTKALCDRLMADPSSLTNVQLPTDLIPRMSSTLARRRGTTSSSIPWTTDELLASAAKAKAVPKNQYSLGAEPKAVSGPPNTNLTATPQHQSTGNMNSNPAVMSYHSDSLELATPTAPFMNPLPQRHHQSNQQGNQVGQTPSPLPVEQGRRGSSFVEYPQPQAAPPYPPSMSLYAPQQQMYPNQPQLPAPHSYRPPQQQPLSQSTTPKSHPASVSPWNAAIGASPETNIQKPSAPSMADNVTISPVTTAQSAATATSATMRPSGSSRPSTATYDSHDTSPLIPNYPAPELMQSQTAGQRGQTPQANVQPQRTAGHPIAMQMSATAAVSPPAPPQNSYLGHSAPYQHSHRNSTSLSRPIDIGEWTAEEVARLHAIIRNSHANVGYQNAHGMAGGGGTTPETDWQKVVNTFNGTRPRHHILNKAVALNYFVPAFMLATPATPASGPVATPEQQQPRKRRRVEGVPESPSSSAAEMGAGTGAANVTAPSPVAQSPVGLSSAQIPTPQPNAPPPLQGFPTASPHMLHSSYGGSPSMAPPPNPQLSQQQAQVQRPVPPPMYNPGPRLPSAAPGAMPVYRVVPAQQHLHQQSGAQPSVNNSSPHTPAFMHSLIGAYPSQSACQPASNGTSTPAIYPSMPYTNTSNMSQPGGAASTGPNAPVSTGANSGATSSPRGSLRLNGESSPHGGNSGSGAGTTTRRAAAAANAANTASSGPTTHYSHPFVNYSAPVPAPPLSYATASTGHSKSKKIGDKNAQLLPSAGPGANGKKSGTRPANGK